MFDLVAKRYDFINWVMALGMDNKWRAELVRSLQLRPADVCVDLATGTADVAILLGHKLKELGGPGRVCGIDPSIQMLAEGHRKVARQGLDPIITLQEGDAQALSLADASVDKVSISFGIRNVPDRLRALQEVRRILKPDYYSRLAILEFCDPEGGILALGARLFIRYGAPRIGALLSGRVNEYMHLQNSILAFPRPPAFAGMMEEAGFIVLRKDYFAFGAVCLYLAQPAP
eukprot:TRINITY_DN4922_c0_g1_i1.p1 TRINITY_DN4922_c0_g1~~TRINITY_DN4922_c0_g1_i1.p1  ORF type:complete len:231 (+),score=14.57 TRINITY_DN4922_c0_g1_i1:127-819(+)